MKKLFPLVFIVVIPMYLFSMENNNNNIEELFYKANQLYKDGEFNDALNTYSEIEKSGNISGDLYYNMGNTYYRLNMIGNAILYYERAKKLIPRDSDLEYNLHFVEKLTKDAVGAPSSVISDMLFWTESLTVNELFVIFAIFNLLFWGILILRLYIKKEWSFYLPIILLVLLLISGISWSWKFYSNINDNRAVILSDEVNVLSGPDEREKLLFQLHAGTIVLYEHTEDGWTLIRLEDKRGWIKNNDIEEINRNYSQNNINLHEQ